MTACVQLTVEQSRAVQSCSEQKGSRGTMLRFGVRAVCWGSWSVESLRLVTDGVPSLGSARRGVAIDETVLERGGGPLCPPRGWLVGAVEEATFTALVVHGGETETRDARPFCI
jgi:hypothetical protein